MRDNSNEFVLFSGFYLDNNSNLVKIATIQSTDEIKTCLVLLKSLDESYINMYVYYNSTNKYVQYSILIYFNRSVLR